MTIKISLILLLLGLFYFNGSAQIGLSLYTPQEMKNVGKWSKYFNQSLVLKNKLPAKNQPSIVLQKYSKSTALFCKIEDKINYNNQLHCFFRLGSLSYVNYLEQKGDPTLLFLDQLK